MHVIKNRQGEFLAFKRYYLADRRALSYIQTNFETWDKVSLTIKLGALGLRDLLPDHSVESVLQCICKSGISQAIIKGDYEFLDLLTQELSLLDDPR